MKKVNELRMGTLLSYVNLGIGSVIPLVYTPIMLRILTQSEYGLYSLANSIIGYLSLLSFGFGTAMIRYITKYKVENDKEGEQNLIGLFIFIYSILAIIVFISGWILAFNSGKLFSNGLSIKEVNELKILIIIMTVNTATIFPTSVFSAITIAHEKFVFRKCTDIFSTIIIPVLNIIVLVLGLKSIGLAISAYIGQIIIVFINFFYCLKRLKIKPKFSNMPFTLMKELISFSGFVFLGSIVDMLYWSTDKVLIGAMMGTTAVAIYNIGGTFNNIIQQLSVGISGVLVPKITGMVFSECSSKELSELFIKIGRLQYIIVSLIVTGFIVFGKQFIMFIAGQGYEKSYYVALLTMIPLSIPLIQNTGLNIITAQNKLKFRSIVYLIVAIVNVISTAICIRYWGIIGAAFCSCVAFTIGNGIIINIYYSRVIGLHIAEFWKNILSMSLAPFSMVFIGFFINSIFQIDKVYNFFVGVIIYTILYMIIMLKSGMNEYEKDIILQPFNIIYKKVIKVN